MAETLMYIHVYVHVVLDIGKNIDTDIHVVSSHIL